MALTEEQLKKLPQRTQGVTAVAGKDTLLYVAAQQNPNEWVLVGGQQNAPLSEKAESIDATDKTTGNYSKKLAGLHSWSISYSGLWITGDLGIAICREYFKNDKSALFRIEYPDGEYRQGWGTITNISDDNSYKNAQSVKMTIEGDGEISDFVQPQTPTIASPTISGTVKDGTLTVSTDDVAIRGIEDARGIRLSYGTDYSLVGNTLTIKKEYLGTLTVPTTLTAKFADKNNIEIKVTAAA